MGSGHLYSCLLQALTRDLIGDRGILELEANDPETVFLLFSIRFKWGLFCALGIESNTHQAFYQFGALKAMRMQLA